MTGSTETGINLIGFISPSSILSIEQSNSLVQRSHVKHDPSSWPSYRDFVIFLRWKAPSRTARRHWLCQASPSLNLMPGKLSGNPARSEKEQAMRSAAGLSNGCCLPRRKGEEGLEKRNQFHFDRTTWGLVYRLVFYVWKGRAMAVGCSRPCPFWFPGSEVGRFLILHVCIIYSKSFPSILILFFHLNSRLLELSIDVD